MELKTRRIVHTGVTRFPTDEWTAQQHQEATLWGKGPKDLIRDRDEKYAPEFKKESSTGERGTWSILVFSLAANQYLPRIQIAMLLVSGSMAIFL